MKIPTTFMVGWAKKTQSDRTSPMPGDALAYFRHDRFRPAIAWGVEPQGPGLSLVLELERPDYILCSLSCSLIAVGGGQD